MKTKLGYLIIATLISLCCVSTISMSYAGSFVTKESTYTTTSASGFYEGLISEKDYDQKYSPEHQPVLDLETTVEAIDYNTAGVTVKNISQAKVEGTFQRTFMLVDLDGEVPSKCWVDHLPVPWPGHSTNYNTNSITIPVEFTQYFKSWRLHVWANFAGPLTIIESDYTNNYDDDQYRN